MTFAAFAFSVRLGRLVVRFALVEASLGRPPGYRAMERDVAQMKDAYAARERRRSGP